MSGVRFAFAGDRDISVHVLDFLLEQGARPAALCVSEPARASHAEALTRRCPFVPPDLVFVGDEFRSGAALERLRALELDYVLSIHFPYLVPREVLELPREGVLNLHPAYLPWNRGWHTPSWAILDGTPVGATLHFMDEGIDTGDVVHQRTLTISPGDTANTLYARLKELELEVFREAWPSLAERSYQRVPQPRDAGTAHRRRELLSDDVQRIELDADVRAGDLVRRLRALTTNRADEAAYYEVDGVRYRVQVRITEERAQ